MPRLFYALWPAADVRGALDEVVGRLELGDCRRVPVANLHITLVFLGAVPAARVQTAIAVGDRISGTGFALELTEFGWWRGPRVAWLGPAQVPPALAALAGDLGRAAAQAGFDVEDRPYRPHLTIARKVLRQPRGGEVASVAWPVADFALVSSVPDAAGASYRVLRQWSLEPVADN